MKFVELKIGDRFQISTFPNSTFEKVTAVYLNCCTKRYNAIGEVDGKKLEIVVNDGDEVILYE